ncbi:CrcB-like protein [Seminavis robusta]|uniref:CrcB-like protein n=1 Tax=Seminavis robusta TaxID=568900 RepID=A0A9N8DEL6_9STRA|nr:CrcB-like protein [Seminavis robusta]|eukprot:Sro104_g052670.1 CrcB-like protein (1122) ;mRNA; f:14195-17560
MTSIGDGDDQATASTKVAVASSSIEDPENRALDEEPLENGHGSEDSVAIIAEGDESKGSGAAAVSSSSDQQQRRRQLKKQSSQRRKSHGAIHNSTDRPLSHYPPRPESRQESPPTAFVDALAQSPLQESWNQFEESVGKPSREALHKFFYPPGNNNNNSNAAAAHHHHHHSPHQMHSPKRRISKRHLTSPGDPDNNHKRNSIKKQQGIPIVDHPLQTPQLDHEGYDRQPTAQQQPQQQEVPNNSDPVVPNDTQHDNSHNTSSGPPNGHHQHHVPAEQPTTRRPPQQQAIHRSISAVSSVDSIPEMSNSQSWPRSPAPLLGQQSPTFQQSFDAEEAQDRKYVERFWTTYDDIIMLSLFTQLGVVARLAASTWFTFFDGVFHKESPLFTNLPLNCFSCFLLGLLGSGDRLMETITTRFTPRNLQQSVVQDYSRGTEYYEYDDDDSNNSDSNYYCGAEDDDHDNNNNGLRRRRRRPKRAKRVTTFHSWQPPLHWHDDLREVQLLALERRIRASKCLLLFPVAKEDADVMEHYFGEGYKASAEKQKTPSRRRSTTTTTKTKPRNRRRRRRFGRQRYAATSMADTDLDDHREGGGHLQDCNGDDDESDSNNNYDDSYGNHSYAREQSESDEMFDDGLFRFDLELTESTEKQQSAKNHAAESKAEANPDASEGVFPPSVQRLIKRPPGCTTTLPPEQGNVTAQETQPEAVQTSTARENSQTQQGAAAAPVSSSLPPQQQLGPQQNGHVAAARPSHPPAPSGAMRVSRSGSDTGSENGASIVTATSGGEGGDPQLEQIISNVQANVSENISRLGRVNLADGWDVGTTPEAMSDDLMLGLRDGFCGALSSFSSWNSSMLNLLREGHIGEAFVGYLLGLQLPIVAYRFGQQVAVYFFVWRCRREARREARKGWYGIRVNMDGSDDESDDSPTRRRDCNNSSGEASSMDDNFDDRSRDRSAEMSFEDGAMSRETPSVRAICTALYLLALVTQFTSLNFFANPEDQQIALSLLFSPVGTLTRWRLSKLNVWRPGFPIGTFACNILACALSGSLGSILAGSPGPKERIFLQSLIAGFGGTLSSLATFIVEILAGMDPLLFRFDGVIYAVCSIFWAMTIGFIFSASVDWADETS